jgi:putative restriction endonuclease
MPLLADSDQLRASIFAFLDELPKRVGPYVRRTDVNAFAYGGQQLRLMEQGGITKPAGWSEALAIVSTSTSVDRGGYEDEDRDDGQRYYRYMRTGGKQAGAMNRSLDQLVATGRPLVYFISVGDGYYEPVYPVFVTGTEGDGVLVSDEPASGEYAELVDLRRYARREQRVRLHQLEFRSRVLFAYRDRCCVCALKHRGLLDAAHIIDDAEESGLAIVSNGLSLCRIHHGAYDQYLLGIAPDLQVQIKRHVLDEIDGPMLRHGLQDMHGSTISLPRHRRDHPSRERLAWKLISSVSAPLLDRGLSSVAASTATGQAMAGPY